jgi:hypothetical protein
MAQNLDPSLETYEGKFRPKNCNETVKDENRKPRVLSDNFCKIDPPVAENKNSYQSEHQEYKRIKRISFFPRTSLQRQTGKVQPLKR